MGLSWAMEKGDVHWEGRVMAAHHALRRSEEVVSAETNDLTALEWDEASRAFYASLLEASQSARLIDLQQKFFDQSRRYRLALLCEGKLNFPARAKRQKKLLDFILAHNIKMALQVLEAEIEAEIKGE